jgi:hypothetical protein
MISEKITSVPTNTAGVYCLFDIDGTAAYAGKSSDLRTDFGSTLFGRTRVPPVTVVSTSGTFGFCNGGKRMTGTKLNKPSSLNTNRISTSTLST